MEIEFKTKAHVDNWYRESMSNIGRVCAYHFVKHGEIPAGFSRGVLFSEKALHDIASEFYKELEIKEPLKKDILC